MPISEYSCRRRVQYTETDASGIVHYTNFFRYAEEAEHAMWRAAGLSVAPADAEIGWPRVAASFEYLKPLRFEDEVDIRVRVVEKSAKTIRYHAELTVGGIVAATGTWVAICVRKPRGGEPIRAIDIPPAIAERFAVTAEVPTRR